MVIKGVFIFLFLFSLSPAQAGKNVKAYITGYQLVKSQTDSTPNYGGWMDNIRGAINAVAVPVGSIFDKRGLCIKVPGFDYPMIVLDHKAPRYDKKTHIDIVVETKKKALKYTGVRNVEIMPVGSCPLIRKIKGGILVQEFSKERFQHPNGWN